MFFLTRKGVVISWLFFVSTVLNAADFSVFNPASVEPGVVSKMIANTPVPTSSGKEAPTQILKQKLPPTLISPEAKKISFVLNDIQIQGNHVFSTAELRALFNPYLHHTITVAKLQMLVQEITDKYQTAGYFLSKAILPPQEIKNGAIKITVVEGFISDVKVQGVKKEALIRFIQKYGNRIEAEKPIKLSTLERYLLLMNDIPGFSVKSVLEPDPSTPLGSKLTLLTVRAPFKLTLSQDNYQTPYLGPNETTGFISANSLIIPGGTFSGRGLVSNPTRKLKYYELKYDQVLGTSGLVFTADGYITNTNPQFVLKPLDVLGQSDDVNATLTYPILRSRVRSLSIQGQFDYMNNISNVLGEPLYQDIIHDASVNLIYNDILWKGIDTVNLTFNKGLGGLGAGAGEVQSGVDVSGLNVFGVVPGGFHSRVGAVGDFFRFIGTVSRTQFIKSKFSLYFMVNGQYANKIVPAAELYTFGGPYLGRGYDWAQFTGDRGIAGKVEFRIDTNPNLFIIKQVQYYAFYDVGRLWSLIPKITPSSGASAGFGLRSPIVKYFYFDGFLAKPLTTPNASQVLMGHSGHSFLGFFQVTAFI